MDYEEYQPLLQATSNEQDLERSRTPRVLRMPWKFADSVYIIETAGLISSKVRSNFQMFLLVMIILVKGFVNEIPFALDSILMKHLDIEYSAWQYTKGMIVIASIIPAALMLLIYPNSLKMNKTILTVASILMMIGMGIQFWGIQRKIMNLILAGILIQGFDDIFVVFGALATIRGLQDEKVHYYALILVAVSRLGFIGSSILLPIAHFMFGNEMLLILWQTLIIFILLAMAFIVLALTSPADTNIMHSFPKDFSNLGYILFHGVSICFNTYSADFLSSKYFGIDLVTTGVFRAIPAIVEVLLLITSISSTNSAKTKLVVPILAALNYFGLGFLDVNPIAFCIVLGVLNSLQSNFLVDTYCQAPLGYAKCQFLMLPKGLIYLIIGATPLIGALVINSYGYEYIFAMFIISGIVQFAVTLHTLLVTAKVHVDGTNTEVPDEIASPKPNSYHLRYSSTQTFSEALSVTESMMSRNLHQIGQEYRVIGPSRYLPRAISIPIYIDSDVSNVSSIE